MMVKKGDKNRLFNLYVIRILLLTIVVSCVQQQEQPLRKDIVARVNDSYLCKKDLKDLVGSDTTPADSTAIVQNYIKSWATRQLFIDQAQENLTASEIENLELLVVDYRNTLYTDAYKEAIIRKSVNMNVTEEEMKDYYDKNSENFNLNEPLIQLRYLHLPPEYDDIVVTKEQFTRYTNDDQIALESKKTRFVSYSFADSVWIRQDQVFQKIPQLQEKGEEVFFRGRKNMTITTDSGVYCIHVNAVRESNKNAPLAYLKPTIEEIIRNQRKLELIKTLEKDITKDAIKNRQFEIYE